MVRALLIVAALALTACESQPHERAATAREPQTALATADSNAHAGLSCAACHRGPKADLGGASVPREACTASGCHEDAGPPEVTLATARFEHRNHGLKSDVALNCAGCHTHDQGKAPLRAAVDACALCHTSDFVGTKADDCRLCHDQPKHVGITSQGIPLAHGALPSLETGCARCHYNVAAPQKKVALETCANCHTGTPDVTRRGIARDLHPAHVGVGCTSCHQAGMHRIGAMSSAVTLQCADCHDVAHKQPITSATQTATCTRCHAQTHSAQQRLVLGFVGNEPVLPSAKFLMGLTCRSCHKPPGGTTAEPRRGQDAACVACHEKEFTRVLEWWITGVRTRERAVGAYIAAANSAVATRSDSARTLLASADSMLALVRQAGGQHNIELSDLIFRTSVSNAVTAYRLAGRAAPPTPEFGNTPHVGTCSFCHYAGMSASGRAGEQASGRPNVLPDLHERLLRTRK
jgi:hypothetical protein